MKTLGILLTAALSTPAFALSGATNIVVLSNGDRMDVESYEIQNNAVVVKTWDGRFRSLPAMYVDIEATESANASASAAERVAPARVAMARDACDAYGIHGTVAVYGSVVDQEIQKFRGDMSIAAFDQLRAAFRNAFDDDRAFDAVVAHFAQNANLDVLQAWTAWLETPFAAYMIRMETTELSGQDAVDASRYYLELVGDADAYARRLALIERLDDARKSTKTGVEVVLYLLEAFFAAGQTVFPDDEIEYDPDELRQQLVPVIRQSSSESALMLFREASDGELENYIAYWKTAEGQRNIDLINAALEAGARQGSVVAMDILAGNRQTVP